ncbi:MAG: hypothetical protein P1U35_14070 [Cycloclasticus sp.]|nr:hypothetical protein [Cycloclasticus sp.]
MCLEDTWYTSILLTLGSWFCVVAGIFVALFISVLVADWAFNQLRIMGLAFDFSIHRKEFKAWKRQKGKDAA